MQINALYATPNVALIPLIILWFGLGTTSKVVIIFLAEGRTLPGAPAMQPERTAAYGGGPDRPL